MRLNKTALLGGVAALALGVGTAGFGVEAEAFDEVHWHWDKHINETITKNVTITVDITPLGDISDQVLQMQIGDVKATSRTHDILNAKPLEEVQWKKGWSLDSGFAADATFNYDLSGSGKIETTNNSTLKNVVRQNTDNTTTTSSFNKDFVKYEVDGSLATTQNDDAPIFVGGAGFAKGETIGGAGALAGGSEPIAGAFVAGLGSGAFGVAALGADATNGDAGFDAELSGAKTTTNNNKQTVLIDNETITENNLFQTSLSSYSYDFEGGGTADLTVNFDAHEIYTFFDVAPKVQDALKELPEVVDQATAIGNLVTIDSDVMVQEHSGQFLFDTVDNRRICKDEQLCEPGPVAKVNFEDADFDLDADLSLNDIEKDLHTENQFHDLALLFGLAAGAGLIDQADISAKSEVYNIVNATGSASATAIGNLKSIGVDTINPNNGVVLADVTQLSVANVDAYATAHNIGVVNYTNLGKLDRAIARSTATAIGNSLNITVDTGQNDGGVPGGNP